MRLPNGYGTVAKLSGKRRRPYIVKKKTLGLNEKGHPIIEIVGYAASREEGLELLAQFNRDPWDVGRAKITLQELSNLWKEKGSKAGRIQPGFPLFGVQALFSLGEQAL